MTVDLLEGVRVVEFSQLIAAPFCGLSLVDLGAEVIKVEAPAGDPMRRFPPHLDDGESALFRVLNRGKRSVVVDLTAAEGRELAEKLIAGADVVIENLGDARAQLPCPYEQVAVVRPEIVWCAISGWGAAEPGRAIDPSLQAAMGMISITGEEHGAAVRIPVPLVDFMTGMYAVQSVLSALWRGRLTGKGAFLDCAMADAAATLLSTSALLASSGLFSPRRLGSESPLAAPSGVFVAGDGRELLIVCVTERHWRALCAAVEHPEWLDDPSFIDNPARIANRALLRSKLAEVIASDASSAWAERISAHGAICERVRDIADAWLDERLVSRGLVGAVPDGHPWAERMPLVSLTAAGARPLTLTRSPGLGVDADAVARELKERQS